MQTMHLTVGMRTRGRLIAVAAVLLAATAACSPDAAGDGAIEQGGDVELQAAGPALDYTVTSENYRKWLVAEEALQRIGRDSVADHIPLTTASEAEVRDLVEELSANEPVRAAIESADLSIADYVRTTVALEQALVAARPSSALRFQGLPAENVVVADRHAAEIAGRRSGSAVRVVDEEWDGGRTAGAGDGDSDDGGKARGRKKGKQKHKHKRKARD